MLLQTGKLLPSAKCRVKSNPHGQGKPEKCNCKNCVGCTKLSSNEVISIFDNNRCIIINVTSKPTISGNITASTVVVCVVFFLTFKLTKSVGKKTNERTKKIDKRYECTRKDKNIANQT